MTGPLPHRDPCTDCGQPHPVRIAADGLRTHRHADGHAWRPNTDTALERITSSTPEQYKVTFGVFAECRRCGLLASNTDAGMASHDSTHAELDRLRAEVARLARIVNGSGSNGVGGGGGEAA